MKGQVNKGKT